MKHKSIFWGALAATSIALTGCGSGNNDSSSTGPGGKQPNATGAALTGTISIDGSSTVFPITQAMAEEFGKANSGVRVTVGMSGSSGGFKKFVHGEIDISDASRAISKSEIEEAAKNGIEFIEIPVAFDGISIVVNASNDFAHDITVAELKKMWEPDSKVKNWNEIRSTYPNLPLTLYGPGFDSGTFDYFTEAINGKSRSIRSDYTSNKPNVLVKGVAGDKGALGFFGYAYYVENKDTLKVLKVDGGNGPVEPTPETIMSSKYAPLSRPLFIYVSKKALDRPEVKEFVKYYLGAEGRKLVSEVKYVPLPDKLYELDQERVDKLVTGSIFEGKEMVGINLEELLTKSGASK